MKNFFFCAVHMFSEENISVQNFLYKVKLVQEAYGTINSVSETNKVVLMICSKGLLENLLLLHN